MPVLGITGTGGSGKSSLTDELVRRLRIDQQDKLRVAVVAVDPTRRKGGGALLGDRIRMNTLDGDRIYFRSLATRGAHELPDYLADVITVLKAAGFDLVVVETPGIGQGDAAVVPYVDTSLYVMTPEFGAASQLEKIDMLDFADVVAINKFERRGAEDAMRDVGRQLVRNREAFGKRPEDMPVFGTSAATFNDDGVTALYQHLAGLLAGEPRPAPRRKAPSPASTYVTPRRSARWSRPTGSATSPRSPRPSAATTPAPTSWSTRPRTAAARSRPSTELVEPVETSAADVVKKLAPRPATSSTSTRRKQLEAWPSVVQEYADHPGRESLSGNRIPRVSLPAYVDHGELVKYFRRENLPGKFPFTAGVFPFKRENEDPARMFAGEGDPARTNRRFKVLSEGLPAARLSTAFDSVTLYGRDPDERPDIYGKVGTSGVSVATLDDMKELYDGFDLLDPTTSVSMTINGPAPTVLAFFLNTAMDQAREKGLDPEEALRTVRGTVQADILKEDQGQNTCLFSTEFSLRCMADIQEWFIEKEVRNFYSVSISGYHIAEAGANPISQLAFTLANGFTYVEAYLARGMDIDDFAPNLSFFFSNGMDPEYSVIGRVARRIWAVAMKEKYGAGERSQKLKYHVQTSGRSLHAQEMDFNDIRTTLQALIAIYDNANSLHTNAFDEAVTTPSTESVRRALAIQLIINREWGLAMNENPLQGSYVIDELTDLVEAGGAQGVRRDQRARRRARRDGDRLPARPDPGRVDALRAPQARRLAADHRRQHLPPARRRRRHPRPRRAGPRDRHREGVAAAPRARVPEGARAGGDRRPGPPQGGRGLRRQRLRGPHGRRPRLHARPGHRGVLRGRRRVPAECLSAVRRRSTAGNHRSGSSASSERHGSWTERSVPRRRAPRRHPRPLHHRGSGVRTPGRARRRDGLVHPPRRPRRHARGAGPRDQEPEPRRRSARCGRTW